MGEVVDITAVRAALERAMALHGKKGIKARKLSLSAGLNATAVRDLLTRVDDPRIGTLIRLATVLEISPASLLGGLVEISGTITEGGKVTLEERGGQTRFVARPPDAIGELLALQVVDEFLIPAYRLGDVVYCSRKHDEIKDDYIGEECIVKLVDGGLFLKVLATSAMPGRYTLRGAFAGMDMENVELEWAAPIRFVLKGHPIDE